jgi:uncharacterized cupredoxin-like copper-binding protein
MTQYIRFVPLAIAAAATVVSNYTSRSTGHEMTIVARDYAFDAPDSVPAGVTTIHLENHGSDLHHVMIVRLESGHTTTEFVEAVETALDNNDPLPTWAKFLGGPNAPAPGMEATATIDLAPGHYLVTCLIPGTDGVSHVMKGMVRPLTVTGTYFAAPLPPALVTMTLVDYGFDLSQPLAAGHQIIRVRNGAAQRHEIELVRIAPGKMLSDLPIWEEQRRNGPPPALPVGGVSPIEPGAEANFMVDLTPGEYGLICFVPDARTGNPHFMHGMMRQITVPPAVDPTLSAR